MQIILCSVSKNLSTNVSLEARCQTPIELIKEHESTGVREFARFFQKRTAAGLQTRIVVVDDRRCAALGALSNVNLKKCNEMINLLKSDEILKGPDLCANYGKCARWEVG